MCRLELYQAGEINYEVAVGMARHAESIKKRASPVVPM